MLTDVNFCVWRFATVRACLAQLLWRGFDDLKVSRRLLGSEVNRGRGSKADRVFPVLYAVSVYTNKMDDVRGPVVLSLSLLT